MAIEIAKYNSELKKPWDDFIERSKNGTFLFYRDYMEYHVDRFKDSSFLFFDDNRLIAVFPTNIRGSILDSHGGLTFGGVLSDRKMRTPLMIDIFSKLIIFLKRVGIDKIIYKAIPYIYHDVPAEEDLYALFINGAKLIRRDVSSTIAVKVRDGFSKGRKWSINKSKQAGIEVRISTNFKEFMSIEEHVLKKYHQCKPVHTTDEIEMLANRFPNNIKLFVSYLEDRMLAGVIVYESKNVTHAQYIASTDKGKKIGAADIIFDYLINQYYADKKYFDFGISTENEGYSLNKGLIANKEGFGSRAVVYDTYELNVE